MRDATGTTVLRWEYLACVRRPISQWLPRREKWFRFERGETWYLIHWLPYRGLWAVSSAPKGRPNDTLHVATARPPEARMKRRQPMPAGVAVVKALPSASTLLPKLPALRAFISETAYEDGTARTPGYWTVRNRVTTFEVTLYDPDSGSRLVCRGATLDETFALAEQLVSVESAPWEPDRYLSEQLAKATRRKPKAS